MVEGILNFNSLGNPTESFGSRALSLWRRLEPELLLKAEYRLALRAMIKKAAQERNTLQDPVSRHRLERNVDLQRILRLQTDGIDQLRRVGPSQLAAETVRQSIIAAKV